MVRATHGPVRVRISRGANGLDDGIHERDARCRGWRQRRVTKATIATGAALAGVVLSTVVVIAGQADLIQSLPRST